jgi:hypothetical protein
MTGNSSFVMKNGQTGRYYEMALWSGGFQSTGWCSTCKPEPERLFLDLENGPHLSGCGLYKDGGMHSGYFAARSKILRCIG